MAYAALVSLAQTIDQILNHQQYSISLHEKQQIISTDKYVFLLQSFLEDFPEEAKSSLEGRIRDAANEAEDVIEYVMWEQIRPRDRLIKWTVALAKVKFKYQLKKVREQFDSIAREAMDIKDSFRIKDVRLGVSPAPSSSSRPAPTSKNDMVGFNDDLLAIKSRLCGESSKRQIIPIFGMGGIGKTTLARNAYNDPLTMEYFQIRAWVTVSQDYSTHQILSSLLVSMKVFNVERSGQSNESMAEKVYKSLKGRRYLIVMDDLWSTKVWDDIKMIFPDDNNGSRIMLTTRLSVVAAYADSFSPLHEMRFLDVDQSWNLLRQKVFKQENCPFELVNIGKMIARSCRGLPLAIVVIAGLLSRVSQTKASWENIAENVNLAVTENNEQFDKVFSLSYTHLPHHLRPCFLYMGGFPEDYEIHVSKLIKLWIAEGFMEPSVSKSFEETAEEYLEDLVKRSLVLVTKRKFNGKIKSCNVHDLVRDLCIRKAQEEKFLLHVMDRCVGKGRAISLRSLGHFRLLRVLDVVHNYVNPLPAEVFELLHLRYLALGNLMRIPAAISNLQNLQTLIIYSGEVYLPLEIWEMPQLRHLVSSFDHLPIPEGATFVLENLQTLSVAANFKFTKRILKMIPNLKHLGICYYAYEYEEDYHLDNLVYLNQLEKLKLLGRPGPLFRLKINPAFPRTLKKLTLSKWRLPWNDMTIVGSLPNLHVLKLRDFACEGDKWETTEGEFPQLKFLLIGQSDLQHWITESSHFPSLKRLLLHHCWRLSEIPDCIGEIPSLQLIEVKGGNKSLVDSAKQIQEEQQSYGNDALQVLCMHH